MGRTSHEAVGPDSGILYDDCRHIPQLRFALAGLLCCSSPFAGQRAFPHPSQQYAKPLLLCLTGSKILAGFLCDAIGARKVALICMVFNIAGLILLATVGGMTSAIIAIIIYSLALPILTVVIPLLAVSLFGYQAQTQYTGIFLSMASAAAIVASPISNAIYDRIGTYNPVFFVAAGVTVLLMGGYLLMYRLADKQKAAIS